MIQFYVVIKNKNNVFKGSDVGNGSQWTLTEKKKQSYSYMCIYDLYLVKIISSVSIAFLGKCIYIEKNGKNPT